MMSFAIPPAVGGQGPAFHDAEGAREWLSKQPLATAAQMESALLQQLQAVDAADIPPLERIAVLDVLRGAVVRAQGDLEVRYARKVLPPAREVADAFALARHLWRALAVAYLRPVPLLAASDAVLPLHRATVTLRLEQFSHFLAGHEAPADLQRLLYGILATAEALGVQRSPVVDPDLAFLGDSHIAGQVAWAFLLLAVDPYSLSAAQLAVANRVFSRWRELAGFQAEPDDDPKARTLLLAHLLPGVDLPEGGPRWLNVRPVVRKLRKRIESLEAGETPESLKLGRELSNRACIALLRTLDRSLTNPVRGAEPPRTVHLAFGLDNAYVAVERRPLNPQGMDVDSERHSHERMAVFGFNNVANLTVAVGKVEVACETWQLSGDTVSRPAAGGGRHLAPCLVALVADQAGASHLGVLRGLRLASDGRLMGRLRTYPEQPLAARMRASGPVAAKAARVPAFLLPGDAPGEYSLIVPPTAGVRPNTGIALDDSPIEHLLVGEVIERGSDFVRFACRAN